MNKRTFKKWIACTLLALLLTLSTFALAELPAYQYTGTDPVEAAAVAWMQDNGIAERYLLDDGAVSIPAPVILKTEQTDDTHMTVYGNFWIFNYKEQDGVLVCISGGEHPGVMELVKDGEAWKATSLEEAGDGAEYSKDIVRFSHGDKDLENAYFSTDAGLNGSLDSVRTRFAADYVKANNLPIVAYQDPFWSPVPLNAEPLTIEGVQQEDGSYLIRIPVRPGEAGEWAASDTQAEGTPALLAESGMDHGFFNARYVPANDGSMAIVLRHYTGIACDQMHTYDLVVKDGKIADVTGGSITYTTPDDDLDPYLSGAWMEKDTQFTTMDIARDAFRGWNVTITSPMTHGAYVFTAHAEYDCELEALVYADGARYDMPAGYDGVSALTDPAETGLTGRLDLSEAKDSIGLTWHDGNAETDFDRIK